MGVAAGAEVCLATVPLDGILIEIASAAEPGELARRMHEFARDLSEQRFPEWGVRIELLESGRLSLAGGRDGTRFEADVHPHPGRVKVELRGRIELAWVKLTLAGGPEGVRRRVTDEIRRALEMHLE